MTNRTREVQLRDYGLTRTIPTRVVQEFETADGEVVEISRNFFAICQPNRDYFGEEVDIYEDSRIVSHDGAWLAGRSGAEPRLETCERCEGSGAEPGIIMPDAAFLVGSRFSRNERPESHWTGPSTSRTISRS